MIEFFRDTLSSHYAILVIVCIFLILASIGYLVTAKLEEKNKKTEPTTPAPQEEAPVEQQA